MGLVGVTFFDPRRDDDAITRIEVGHLRQVQDLAGAVASCRLGALLRGNRFLPPRFLVGSLLVELARHRPQDDTGAFVDRALC